MNVREFQQCLRHWRVYAACLVVVGASLAGNSVRIGTGTGPPPLAFATANALQVRLPSGTIDTIASVPNTESVVGIVWSQDQQQVAWMEASQTSVTLYDYDFRSKQLGSWPCTCSGVDFQGNHLLSDLVTQTQPPRSSSRGLLQYALGSKQPKQVAIADLPVPESGTVSQVYLLTTDPVSSNVFIAYVETLSGEPMESLYRVDAAGNASLVYTSQNDFAIQDMTVSADGNWVAYAHADVKKAFGMGDGLSDLCDVNAEVTLLNLQTGASSTSDPVPINTTYSSNNTVLSMWFGEYDSLNITEDVDLRCDSSDDLVADNPARYVLVDGKWQAKENVMFGSSAPHDWQAELLVPETYTGSTSGDLYVVHNNIFHKVASNVLVFSWATTS